MGDEVRVVSSDLDGAERRRWQKGRFMQCDGRDDCEELQDALDGKQLYGIPGRFWDRIFGRRE